MPIVASPPSNSLLVLLHAQLDHANVCATLRPCGLIVHLTNGETWTITQDSSDLWRAVHSFGTVVELPPPTATDPSAALKGVLKFTGLLRRDAAVSLAASLRAIKSQIDTLNYSEIAEEIDAALTQANR
jgi:hypothetical protein